MYVINWIGSNTLPHLATRMTVTKHAKMSGTGSHKGLLAKNAVPGRYEESLKIPQPRRRNQFDRTYTRQCVYNINHAQYFYTKITWARGNTKTSSFGKQQWIKLRTGLPSFRILKYTFDRFLPTDSRTCTNGRTFHRKTSVSNNRQQNLMQKNSKGVLFSQNNICDQSNTLQNI